LPPGGVTVGVFEQEGPAGEAGGWDGDPLSKSAPGRSKSKAFSGVDERLNVGGLEFDDQQPGARVPGGEEVTIET
jgi:hypothetical protein